MTDRLAVTLTADELFAMMKLAAGQAVSEHLAAVAAPSPDELLSKAQVMEMFGVTHKDTILTWRRRDGFPAPRKFGHGVRWRRGDVEAWRASRQTSGPGAAPAEDTRRRRTEGRAASAH